MSVSVASRQNGVEPTSEICPESLGFTFERVIPQASLITMRVAFTPADLDAGRRSMKCQKTQFPQEAADRVIPAMSDAWKGAIPLSPMVPGVAGDDLLR